MSAWNPVPQPRRLRPQRRADWRKSPRAVEIFQSYCAPTALAGLMDCPAREAAELLASVPGMLHRSKGAVHGYAWQRYLVQDLGLVEVSTRHSDEEAEALAQKARERQGWEDGEYERYVPRQGRYWDTEVRQSAPWAGQAIYRYPTLAQWLKDHPNATGIVDVASHTLYVEKGKVKADTMNSKRKRIMSAFLLPEEL